MKLISSALCLAAMCAVGLNAQSMKTKGKTKVKVKEGQEMTISGCIAANPGGGYMLTTTTGDMKYALITNDDLSKHVGHRMEFMGKATFNYVNYGDEGQKRLDDLTALLARATAVSDSLPANKKDGFYEMVLYPIRASKLQNEKYIAAGKADLYAGQGRTASVTKYRNMSTTAYNTIRSDLTYYNNTLAGGKWQKMMDPYNSGHGQPVIEGMPSLASVPGRGDLSALDSDLLLAELLAGKTAALARAISVVENARPGFEQLLARVHHSVGRARRIGLTGPPGAGKSTLVERLVAADGP